ncbi:MAG TPA: T9SS type A sorting domain-containing protein [Bacteroidales bacterium]|nr:T9SS type A sorting domain-containing protein [Bacteroidales bacterium]
MKKILLLAFAIFFTTTLLQAQMRVDTPVAVAPADEAVKQMPNVILDWTAVVNATSYEIVIALDENFTDVVVNEFTPYSAFQTCCLMFHTQYFWRARAIDGEDVSGWTETRSFTTFDFFELDKPGDNATGEKANVALKWKEKMPGNANKLSGFTYYQIQVDTVPFNGTSPIWNIFAPQKGQKEYLIKYVYYGQKHYWRMRAVHDTDSSEWTEVRSFTTDNAIVLKKPDNGEVNSRLNHELRWTEFKGTQTYDYQIHINENWTNALMYFVDSVRVPTPPLKYGTTYYWHVRGQNIRDTSGWSETRTFTTASAVDLKSPENGIDSVPTKPQLKWSQIKGSTSYRIEYSKDADFSDPYHTYKPTNDNETTPYYYLIETLEHNTEYFWRIRATTSYDTSDYSEVFSFTTVDATGINDYFNNTNVTMYPNPATESTTLQMMVDTPSEATWSITDLTGKVLRTEAVKLNTGNNAVRIDLKNMARGVYLLNLTNQKSIYNTKLVIR